MRTFKYVCKVCHKRQTNAEDQICATCRRNGKKMPLCISCGEIHTASPDGICWRCRLGGGDGALSDPEVLKAAFERSKLITIIFKHRLDGLSFADIAQIVNLPVQTCYSIARREASYVQKKK